MTTYYKHSLLYGNETFKKRLPPNIIFALLIMTAPLPNNIKYSKRQHIMVDEGKVHILIICFEGTTQWYRERTIH